jgi:[NiFe] hydrogenase diaphorase moiety large subunit
LDSEVERLAVEVCGRYDRDRLRMMDIVREVQTRLGSVPGSAMEVIARETGTHRVEVESVVSFYAFLSRSRKGKVVIRLCDDLIDRLNGYEEVAAAFRNELGVEVGQTTPDGVFTLERTPCIGMCDQAPAALVNDEVITELSPDRVVKLVAELRADPDPSRLVHRYGDGNNAGKLIHSMVNNNVRRKAEVIFAGYEPGAGLRKALAQTPQEVIRELKTARLRGRGGAGFPTGMKWEFTRRSSGDRRYVLCNADEGEPGTFKDRVLLTERAAMVLEGMAAAGYAIGSDTGILYLRAEYAYLLRHLEALLAELRDRGLLGRDICGRKGFDFDVRIQMGAGAYVCGEESALISSCEGLRGDPKNRPPFPAQKGYLQSPTTVNNVETFCCVARILEKGSGWFAGIGSQGSPGTKLLSVSGDVKSPGVYEVPFGIRLGEFLKMCGADDAAAVQVGGPSGQMVDPTQFHRRIEYDDLATGGSVMVFNAERDVIDIVHRFAEFFAEESCGYCTPCRVGNALMLERLEKILDGNGEPCDLAYLEDLGRTMKVTSRCGLGQTAGNPVLTSLENFKEVYERRVQQAPDGLQPSFDLDAALADAVKVAGRGPAHLD